MADAAEVLPLPEEEPANEAPKNDDSAAADDSGNDVSFGTFLTVGPKETRDVTIVGYDSTRGTVRAVRRSGDSVETIQIPYDKYKALIETQRKSDLATGRKTKKNLSKAVRGFFGKSVALDGKSSQVIGYDAQNDEVLVNDGSGSRWMKSGEMLRSTQNLSSVLPSNAPSSTASRAKRKTAAETKAPVVSERPEIGTPEDLLAQRKAIALQMKDQYDKKYLLENFSGEISPRGYLLKKDGTESYVMPTMLLKKDAEDRVFAEAKKEISPPAPLKVEATTPAAETKAPVVSERPEIGTPEDLLAQRKSLEIQMKNKDDRKYILDHYSGEISPRGYLLRKDGTESYEQPTMISSKADEDRVFAEAKQEFRPSAPPKTESVTPVAETKQPFVSERPEIGTPEDLLAQRKAIALQMKDQYDKKYLLENFSGEISPRGYLLKKDGTESYVMPTMLLKKDAEDRVFAEAKVEIGSSAPPKTEASVTVEAQSTGAASPAPSSIRETRAELKASRSSAGGAPVQNAVAVVATVAAGLPAASNALPVIAAVQNALNTYADSSATRQAQMQQLSGQISETSNRINALQQRSRQAQAAGDTTVQFEQQINQLQSTRSTLLNQQTDAQVRGINEDNKAGEIAKAVQQLQPDANGMVPQEQVAQVQRLLPTLAISPILESQNAAAAAALPRPAPVATPRTYAPGIPSRGTSRAPSPSVRTPKPIRPLGGSLSSIGGQTQRAADFYADQAYDRRAEDSQLSDSSEEALSTSGGLPGFSGPLDSPQARTQSYAAGADTEPEEADIFGAQEEEADARQARINQGVPEELPPGNQLSEREEGQPSEFESGPMPEQPQGQPPAGPTPQEISRVNALQRGTSQSVLQRDKQDQAKEKASSQNAAEQAANKKKQIDTAKKTISNLIDAFDAAHGLADIVGLFVTFGHLNLRMILAWPFDRDLPFVPKAGFPYECGAIGCFDVLLCISSLFYVMVPIIILASIFTTIGGTGLFIADLFGLLPQ